MACFIPEACAGNETEQPGQLATPCLTSRSFARLFFSLRRRCCLGMGRDVLRADEFFLRLLRDRLCFLFVFFFFLAHAKESWPGPLASPSVRPHPHFHAQE